MPLGRFKVRNEYGLGAKELYKNGCEFEDTKVVVDGVAVAGLVGLLRQLGDLTLFAAEVFHGLQEQVASTVCRSRKLVTRVQHVEAALPSLEKAILSQTNHIHFAYSPGSEWHPHIKNEQNHFICDDLPPFIMDSYEECLEPPRLQLLDRFDPRGPGSCSNRYSDPTFFRRASSSSVASTRNKSQRDIKARKIKRRKPWQRSGQFPSCVSTMSNSGRIQISSQTHQGEPSLSHSGSTLDRSFKSDLGDQTDFFGSNVSIRPDKIENKASSSTMGETIVDSGQVNDLNEQITVVGKGIQGGLAADTAEQSRPDVTWDEKLEIIERMGLNYEIENAQHVSETNHYQHLKEMTPVTAESINQVDDLSENGSITMSKADKNYTEAIINLKLIEPREFNYLNETGVKTFERNISQLEDLSEVASCTESDSDGHRLRRTMDENIVESVGLSYLHEQEVKPVDDKSFSHVQGLPQHGTNKELSAEKDNGIDETNHDPVQMYPESLSQITNFSKGENSPHHDDLMLNNRDSIPQGMGISEGENSLKLSDTEDLTSDPLHHKLGTEDTQYRLETTDASKWAIERIEAEDVGIASALAAKLSKGEDTPDSSADRSLVSDGRYMLETKVDCSNLEAATTNDKYNGPVDTSNKEVNSMSLCEWSHHDDIDSETDNFVDALNTIDSESESEYETQTRRQEKASASVCKLPGVASTVLMLDKVTQSELNHESNSRRPLANVEHVEDAETSHQSEVVASQELSVENPPSLSTVSLITDRCVNANDIRLEPAESSLQDSHDNKIDCKLHLSEEMPIGNTSSYPHALWTNGTLFGLQPSKPIVVSTSYSAPTTGGNDNIKDQGSSEVEGSEITTLSSVKNYDNSDTIDGNCQDVGFLKQVSRNVSDKKYNQTLDHGERIINDDLAVPGLSNGHAAISESKVSSHADWKNGISEATNASEDRSSLLSLIDRSLHKNGLRRSGSLDYDDKNKQNDPLPSVSNSISRSNLNGKLQYPLNSPPPSPPLELMKISFWPIDGFETSKLKLKYPEGIDNHEITVESFPSFQLVPQSTGLQHDMGSDSDDDTFCRSYPCLSDDSMSHLSDSDSEHWEAGHTSESNDHGLRRISSKGSSSSSSQHEEKDQRSTRVGFNSFKEMHSTSGPVSQSLILDSSDLQGLTPQLPPLPPLQWRVSRPMLDEEVDKPEQGYDSPNHSYEAQFLVSAASQPDPGDAEKLQTGMRQSDTVVKQTKQVAEEKVDDKKQIFSVADGKTMDEPGDFLHQIRTKSFNLKRTDTGRSVYTPSLETSTQVSAILQKATAIRQAVGSDGEDSSWSDT
ncbi:hypothetical protein vseg_008916 [Gypsophila vaccaria]